MNSEINRSEYHRLVEEEWANSAVANSWAKWHDKFNSQCRSITTALLARAQIRPGMRVLDLASGTGEPAITIAGLFEGQGNITATDLSAEMLTVARSKAEQEASTICHFSKRRRRTFHSTITPSTQSPADSESCFSSTCRGLAGNSPGFKAGWKDDIQRLGSPRFRHLRGVCPRSILCPKTASSPAT